MLFLIQNNKDFEQYWMSKYIMRSCSQKKKVSWILCKEKFVHLEGKEIIMPCGLYCAQ